jgi:hypothetical protein
VSCLIREVFCGVQESKSVFVEVEVKRIWGFGIEGDGIEKMELMLLVIEAVSGEKTVVE